MSRRKQTKPQHLWIDDSAVTPEARHQPSEETSYPSISESKKSPRSEYAEGGGEISHNHATHESNAKRAKTSHNHDNSVVTLKGDVTNHDDYKPQKNQISHSISQSYPRVNGNNVTSTETKELPNGNHGHCSFGNAKSDGINNCSENSPSPLIPKSTSTSLCDTQPCSDITTLENSHSNITTSVNDTVLKNPTAAARKNSNIYSVHNHNGYNHTQNSSQSLNNHTGIPHSSVSKTSKLYDTSPNLHSNVNISQSCREENRAACDVKHPADRDAGRHDNHNIQNNSLSIPNTKSLRRHSNSLSSAEDGNNNNNTQDSSDEAQSPGKAHNFDNSSPEEKYDVDRIQNSSTPLRRTNIEIKKPINSGYTDKDTLDQKDTNDRSLPTESIESNYKEIPTRSEIVPTPGDDTRTRVNNRYPCQVCGLVLSNLGDLGLHVQEHLTPAAATSGHLPEHLSSALAAQHLPTHLSPRYFYKGELPPSGQHAAVCPSSSNQTTNQTTSHTASHALSQPQPPAAMSSGPQSVTMQQQGSSIHDNHHHLSNSSLGNQGNTTSSPPPPQPAMPPAAHAHPARHSLSETQRALINNPALSPQSEKTLSADSEVDRTRFNFHTPWEEFDKARAISSASGVKSESGESSAGDTGSRLKSPRNNNYVSAMNSPGGSMGASGASFNLSLPSTPSELWRNTSLFMTASQMTSQLPALLSPGAAQHAMRNHISNYYANVAAANTPYNGNHSRESSSERTPGSDKISKYSPHERSRHLSTGSYEHAHLLQQRQRCESTPPASQYRARFHSQSSDATPHMTPRDAHDNNNTSSTNAAYLHQQQQLSQHSQRLFGYKQFGSSSSIDGDRLNSSGDTARSVDTMRSDSSSRSGGDFEPGQIAPNTTIPTVKTEKHQPGYGESSSTSSNSKQQDALDNLKSLTASTFAYPSLPGFANAFGSHPWPTAAAANMSKFQSSAVNGYMQRIAGEASAALYSQRMSAAGSGLPFRSSLGKQTDAGLACQYCGKVCPRPSILKRHMMMHTGERPFECKVCGQRFRAKGSMLFHQKLRHNMDVKLNKALEERYL